MRGCRNFRQGGRGSRSICHKKISDNVFLVLLVVRHLFYRIWFISKKIITSEVPEGLQHFSRGGGGPTFSRGIQLLIPYRIPYNLCFSRGVRAPCPPLDQRMQYLDQLDVVSYEKKLSILTLLLGIPKCIHGVWESNHSGLTMIQIVVPGSDNFGSNPLYFTFCIQTLTDMSSADNLCK